MLCYMKNARQEKSSPSRVTQLVGALSHMLKKGRLQVQSPIGVHVGSKEQYFSLTSVFLSLSPPLCPSLPLSLSKILKSIKTYKIITLGLD